MNLVFLAFGSNLGNRQEHLHFAVKELERRGFTVQAMSKIYRSEAVGSGGTAEFLNAVVRGTTALSPLELLSICQEVEELAGRAKPAFEGAKREGERALDVDILMFGEETINTPALQIPHPRALERAFVLRPLLDVLNSTGTVATKLRW
ncbi:2-amino-4-hydroxy-6-hydroxymethyldihydropteridine pyrophosphokinase [Abditibacteriota bacterium]|nr:2-amino-4-hydroxy-6-hydroxymethyldihydropteridine pyrophosphokinase [Abditibacteriota bacterium]